MFQVGDIVLSAPGWSKGVFCITEINLNNPANIYKGINLTNQKIYRLNEKSLSVKVGTATPEFLQGNNKPTEPNQNSIGDDVRYQRGKLRATREAQFAYLEPDKKRWALLASLKPGDPIQLRTRSKTVTGKFHCVLERGEKFVFLASNENGTTYKYPLATIPEVKEPSSAI